MRRALRVFGWVGLGLTFLLSSLLVAGYVYLRSERGHKRILVLALDRLGQLFPGGFTVGRVDGDFRHGFVLHDVTVRDLEKVPAIFAEVVEVRYHLLELFDRRLHVAYLGGRGVTVVSRRLANGRNSLATLMKTDPSSKASLKLPNTFLLEDVDVDARFVHLPKTTMAIDEGPSDLDWRGRIRGSASLSTERKRLVVDALRVDLSHPTIATVRARGKLDFVGLVTYQNTEVRVDADASEVRRRVKAAHLLGPIVVIVHADGTIENLKTTVKASASAQGLRFATGAYLGRDHVQLDGLELEAPKTRLHGSGRIDFDGHFVAKTRAQVTDLSQLRLFGAPSVSGAATVDSEVEWTRHRLRVKAKGTADRLVFDQRRLEHGAVDGEIEWTRHRLRIKGKGSADRLVAGELRLDHGAADIDTLDLLGTVKLAIQGLERRNVRLNTATLEARATKTAMRIQLDAAGPRRTALALRILGKPILEGTRYVGIDAKIEALSARIGRMFWASPHPSHLRVRLLGPVIALDSLELVSEQQRVTLGGKIDHRSFDQVHVDVQHFDVSKLAPLVAPGRLLPKSDLSAELRAHGPFDDPVVTAHFAGQVYGRGERDTIHVIGEGQGVLQKQRAVGKLFATIGGQKVDAHFDLPMPLRPAARIDATIDASVLFSPAFSELLVPKLIQFQPVAMHSFSGLVTAQVRVSGATSTPEVHVTAKVARGGFGRSIGELGLSAEYKDRLFSTEAKIALSSLPAGGGSGGGIVEASAKLPLDLSIPLTGRSGSMMRPDAAVHASVKLQHLGLDYLPFDAFRWKSPIKHGALDGRIELGGTLTRPQVVGDIKASGLETRGVEKIGFGVHSSIEGRALTADGTISVQESEALRFRLSIDGNRHKGAGELEWKHAALDAILSIDSFDLRKLGAPASLQGKLRGDIKLGGAIRRPSVRATIEASELSIGAIPFEAFKASVRLEDDLEASLIATQTGGAKLEGMLKWSLGNGPVRGKLVASRFLVNLHGDNMPGIRLLRGRVDAELRLDGTNRTPQLHGQASLQGGELRVPSTAMSYRDIDAHLRIDEHAIVLESLRLRAGELGEAEASGKLTLVGFAPTHIDAKIQARQFPVQQQGISVLLNSEVLIDGSRSSDGALNGRIRVQKGSAQLPELQSTRVLHSTAPLQDVQLVGEDKRRSGIALQLAASFDGPFVVRSKELNAKVRGRIAVDLSGPTPTLRGQLKIEPGAWVDLFGRRYDLERGQVDFDGSSDPLLGFRISRRMHNVTIGADVTGRAKQPEVAFWSSPPKLDATQVVAVILSGDPGSVGVSTRGLERQAVGAVSSLVVNSIKQNLLPELPIDVLRFDTNQSKGTNAQGSHVEIGKYLTQSLYVGYAYQIGVDRIGTRRANRNEARVDYRLPRNWQVEGTFGDAGGGGVDLYWTYRP